MKNFDLTNLKSDGVVDEYLSTSERLHVRVEEENVADLNCKNEDLLA